MAMRFGLWITFSGLAVDERESTWQECAQPAGHPNLIIFEILLLEGGHSMSITNPDDLLAQVAAGLQSNCDAEVIAEAAELAEAERARVRLVDRWPATSNPISIRSIGLPAVFGTVVAASATVVVVATSSWNLWALSTAAVVCVEGLAAGLRDDGPDRVIPAVTWPSFLRGLAGELVQVHTIDEITRTGELVGVGADHLDLIGGGAGQLGSRATIAFTALAAVQALARRDGFPQSRR